jgi:nucleoside-diphosphate-sugar epimerase/glycosyltransferase involved in cell wall biosynthesis
MTTVSTLDPRTDKELIDDLEGPIAIFGAGGFIGANLTRTIGAHRRDVYAITHHAYIPWRLVGLQDTTTTVKCDITVPSEVRDLFRTYRFRTVLFFATYGGYSKQSNVEQIYQTNIIGLLNVLSAAEESGIAAFVHAGSQSEYGLNCSGSKEDWALAPNSHYAVSKVSASYMIMHWGKQKEMPCVNLRLYSVFGPWEEPDRLIPTVIENGLKGSYPPFVDPDISRDFVYISDVSRATLLAAVRGVHSARGESINVASGVKTTIREVAHVSKDIFALAGDPAWGSMSNRAWDLKDWYGDASKAREKLGWAPQMSFVEGLRAHTTWVRDTQTPTHPSVSARVNTPIRISTIIACYLDAQAMPIMYQRLKEVFSSMRVEYEIIFVNDGSPDNTASVAAEIAARDPWVVVIEHSRNFGSQSAFLSGMQVATGHAVVLLDGDLQDPPELIPQFFEKWHDEHFEVVYGRRVQRDASGFMRFAYKAFYRVFRFMADIKIPVDAGDFSLIDRRVVEQMLKLPETDQFLRGLRAWVGFKQTGVDYHRPERMFGVSTNNLRKNLRWARKGIFSFSYAPLEMLLLGGIALMALALVAVLVTLAVWLVDPNVPRGLTTIVSLILGFGGLQLFATAIVGEYVGKILDETKKRPKFIVRSITQGSKQAITSAEVEAILEERRGFLRKWRS